MPLTMAIDPSRAGCEESPSARDICQSHVNPYAMREGRTDGEGELPVGAAFAIADPSSRLAPRRRR